MRGRKGHSFKISKSRLNKAFLDHTWPKFSSCQWCLKELTRDQATADHVRPRSKGGSSKWYNLIVSCYHCNHSRRNKIADTDLIHGPIWSLPRYWCTCHAELTFIEC